MLTSQSEIPAAKVFLFSYVALAVTSKWFQTDGIECVWISQKKYFVLTLTDSGNERYSILVKYLKILKWR